MTKPYGGGKPTFEEFITPIGMVCHLFHDKPQLKTTDQLGKVPDMDPETGLQRAEYKITLAWSKQRMAELTPLIELANKVKATAWPESMKPGAFFALQPFFRDGDNPEHNTNGKDYLKGRYYLNFKAKSDAKRDAQTGQIIYSGAPGLLGPYGDSIMPTDIYPGCTARCSGIMFGTEYMGKHFISTRLNNIQLFENCEMNPALERIGGSKPTAASQFGALKEGAGQVMGSTMNGLQGLL